MNDNLAYAEKAVLPENVRANEYADIAVKPEIEAPDIIEKTEKKYFYRLVKRMFDIIVSFLGLIILSPLFLVLITAIKTDSPGNAFYSQRRIGKNGKTFKLYKLRSMVHNANEVFLNFTSEQKKEFEKNFKLDNDPRITRMGAFIRKTSLDELPQLLNILRGDISVVGPRPVVEYEIYKYGEKADKFNSVKPGLTGYWQVNGRNDTSYEERIQMDMYYIDNRGFLLDLKIIFKTVKVVLRGKGAY